MRDLVLKMSISADGFVGGPNGEIDWLLKTMDQSTMAWITETLWDAGVHIMGSRTYYDMAAYWPTATEPMAAPMNQIPKLVFSKKGLAPSLQKGLTTQALKDSTRLNEEKGVSPVSDPHQGATSWIDVAVATGNLYEEILRLKQQPGKRIIAHGGVGFARELVKHRLIDEFRLLVHPVLLGKGLALFSGLESPLHLRLISTTKLNSGVLANTYKSE